MKSIPDTGKEIKAAEGSNEALANASELLQAKQAETLEAMAGVDMAEIVRAIESDANEGGMSHGQRKSAHLLLTYYAPKLQAIQPLASDTQTMDGLTTASIVSILELIQGITGQNTVQHSQPIDIAGKTPSLPAFESTAGVTSRPAVLTDTPIPNRIHGRDDDTTIPNVSEVPNGKLK